jgi:hypothetical protein
MWDLDRDGISYTMLSKFTCCRERFRVAYVEGWSESGFNAPLEFGSAFHECLESPEQPPEKITRKFQEARLRSGAIFPNQLPDFEQLMALVEATVHGYWAEYGKEDRLKKNYIYREHNFDVQYEVPAISRPFRLRGRWDAVYRDVDGKLWLLETKTKSDIDSDGIGRTLAQDMQTMLYVSTLEALMGEKVRGVVYNVIRRPQYRLGKKENIQEFAVRVREKILESVKKPEAEGRFFFRWEHTFNKNDVAEWQERTLNPLLAQLRMWWDEFEGNPFDPWKNVHHYQRPFGVYDSLASGRRGDFFEYMTGGSTSGLVKRTTAFPELT